MEYNASSNLGRMPLLNNKQKYKPAPQQTGSATHLALPIRGKTNKQKLRETHKHTLTKRKNKLSTNLMLHKAYTNHWTNLRQAETKKKKEFNLEGWEKETSNTIS